MGEDSVLQSSPDSEDVLGIQEWIEMRKYAGLRERAMLVESNYLPLKMFRLDQPDPRKASLIQFALKLNAIENEERSNYTKVLTLQR